MLNFLTLIIPKAFCHNGWSNVMQGTGILDFLASSMTNRRVEYMQFSSDEFKSIIGRNFTEATSYTVEDCDVACIMKPDQFGRGSLDEAKTMQRAKLNRVSFQQRV